MTVLLREIPASGLRVGFDLSHGWAAESLAGSLVDVSCATLRAEVVLLRSHHDVIVQGKIFGGFDVPCARCTAAAAFALDLPFALTFVPTGEDRDDDLELSEEDLDVVPYTDEEIKLSDVFREQILLSLPIAHLCREDCKGLCPVCGKDRNESPCGCSSESKGGRFAVLKDLKLD